ncbi:MAG: hypothetical protein R8G34_05195 [Paracoccaceae bacterium]|nr:hypothetical protein [Paracoccaceae bacterium]
MRANAWDGFDWPILDRKNCSFVRAGQSRYFDLAGAYAVDLKEGKVGQRISNQSYCRQADDYALIADCVAGQAVMVKLSRSFVYQLPRGFREREGYVFQDTPNARSFHWVPNGDVSTVSAAASTRGYEVTPASDFLSQMRSRNRFDAFCGCKHYYPDSAGAKQ